MNPETLKKKLYQASNKEGNERVEGRRFRVPRIPRVEDELPEKRKYPKLENLMGKPSYEVARYIAEQFYFGGMRVPIIDDKGQNFVENPYYLMFRWYQSGVHLRATQKRLLKDAPDEPETGIGIHELLCGGLERFMEKSGRRLFHSPGYNRFALENRIIFHQLPDYQMYRDGKRWKDFLKCRNLFQLTLASSPFQLNKNEKKSWRKHENWYKSIQENRQGYLMFVDFLFPPTDADLELMRKAFQLRYWDQGIPLEGVIFESSKGGTHFIGTNPVMNRHQYLSLRRFFEQFNAINDTHALKQLLVDTHHLITHFENPSYDQGMRGKKIIPKKGTESNALRLTPDASGEFPKVIEVIRPPEGFIDELPDEFKTFQYEEHFGPTD